MEDQRTVERGATFLDADKRNVGRRLVQVEYLFYGFDVHGERLPYAACRILTAGGRPCRWAPPELQGTGAVGQMTHIRVDRLLARRYYLPVPPPSFDTFEAYDPRIAA